MRIVFVAEVILLLALGAHNVNGGHCGSDADCMSFESCQNGRCTLCTKEGAVCRTEFLAWPCCDGSTCEYIPGLNTTMCVPRQNKCQTDSDCIGGLRCVVRLGKCGICRDFGEKCTLPYDSLECCSGYCKTSYYFDNVCAAPGIQYPSVVQVG